ncbi:hypothetical protein ARTHRO8AJ_440199 [Arthrobacter sp. 8AJ]|nr:hypothetical protein ARTHRO8AJ_440199 [Arthrobacter sp. 8AJ]
MKARAGKRIHVETRRVNQQFNKPVVRVLARVS